MSTITVAIVITEGFSTFHVSVPLILFGEILEGRALFSRRVCAERHCCKVSDEAAFCLIQRPYISKTLLTRRISPRGSP
ncbi:hypothetical protein FQY32_21910 [Salmonella enterica]|nr:hypothetical protein [Salmonella enterica]